MSDHAYLDLDLPERFALETRSPAGSWLLWNTYEARWFERQADGSYVCGSVEGCSPTFLRCVARHDGWFEHEYGGGEFHAYRIVRLDPNEI